MACQRKEAMDVSSPGLHHQHIFFCGICFSSVKWNLYAWTYTFNSQVAIPWKSAVLHTNSLARWSPPMVLSQNEWPWKASITECNQDFNLLYSIQKLPPVRLIKLCQHNFIHSPWFIYSSDTLKRKRYWVVHGSWLPINIRTGSCSVYPMRALMRGL